MNKKELCYFIIEREEKYPKHYKIEPKMTYGCSTTSSALYHLYGSLNYDGVNAQLIITYDGTWFVHKNFNNISSALVWLENNEDFIVRRAKKIWDEIITVQIAVIERNALIGRM